MLFYTTVYLIKYIKNSLSKVIKAASRFPLVTLSAILSFIFIIVYFHFFLHFEVSRRQWIFTAYECIVGISLFFAFAIFSEKYKVDIGKRIGLGLLGICILGLHYFALPNWAINIDATYFLRFFTIWIIFCLLVSFILFYKEEEKLAFWQFNQYIVIQFFLSSAFSIALFVGMASSFYAIEKLFEVTIADAYYIELFAFFGLIVNTLFFSASVPDDLNSFKEQQSFRKPLRIFIQYVLLPILLIYYVILIVYLGKIVMVGVLPEGWVGLPILIFSMLGTLTFFLAYPFSYDKGRTSIRFFIQYFFYFLLPLITLLIAAVLTRVFQYGFTEYRYLALLLAAWLAIITLYTVLRKEVSLVVLPVSLFILLFMGSVGPWGMYKLSARSQFNRLCVLLDNNDLLDNKVLAVKKIPEVITDSLSREIGSINKFLFYREKIDLIYPILAENEKKQIDSLRSSDNKLYSFNQFLNKTFSLPANEQLPDYRRYHFFTNSDEKISLGIKDYSSFEVVSFKNLSTDTSSVLFMQSDTLQFVQGIDSFRFALFPYIDSLSAYYFLQPNLANLPFDEYVNIQTSLNNLSFQSSDTRSTLIFKELLFRKNSDSTIHIEDASFYFFR